MISCSSNIKNMDGITVENSDKESGLTVFKTKDDLHGVADADGNIVLDAEYGSISLYGPFIVAQLSDKKFDEELQMAAKKAGVDEKHMKNWKPSDDVKEIKHEFIVPGYNNIYYRLFASNGKMLKDYSRGGTAYRNELMGDTVIWKSTQNVDSNRDCQQLVTLNGETIDIENFNITPKTWGYTTKDGRMYQNMNGVMTELWGKKVGEYKEFIITKGYASNPHSKTLNIFCGNGKFCTPKGYDVIKWTEDPDGNGIFVKAIEGNESRGEKRGFYARPQKHFYITEDGTVQDIPEGYYEKNPYGNTVDLYSPDGRMVGRWND